MEVLVLNDHAHVNGGSSAVALASARGLAASGIRTTLFSGVGPVDPSLRSVPGLEVICLDQPEIARDPNRLRAFTGGLRNGVAVRALEQRLAASDPADTIVHMHTWTKSLSPFALHTAIRRGFKVLITLHDFFIACPTGSLFLPKSAQLCPKEPLSWDCLRCSCDRRHYAHKLWRSARTFLQNNLLRIPEGVAHFVGVSEFSASLMRPWLPPGTPVTVVRNPVDCLDLGPASVAENAPLLFIGRFSQEKGVLLAAAAVQRLGVPAVFIGDGELAAEARAMCPGAIFTGWLPPEEIRAWLKKARALLFPPLWYETLGLVVVEAAASGVPAIISDRCAATDFLGDGERGLHFRHGSLDSLCAQIERIRDDALASRLGRNAYEWYWDAPWSIENHVAELTALYARVLADRPARVAA
ncbi:MAG TPA: glycosyltransferase family 4 protein [Chthoniobacteraceae bacterium]